MVHGRFKANVSFDSYEKMYEFDGVMNRLYNENVADKMKIGMNNIITLDFNGRVVRYNTTGSILIIAESEDGLRELKSKLESETKYVIEER